MYYETNNNNNKFNKEEFFEVYPPSLKIINPTESNKFIKLFAKPIKRGFQRKKTNIANNQNNSFGSSKKNNLELIEESLNETLRMFSSKNSFANTFKNKEKDTNSVDTKSKQNDISNLEYSNEEENNYYLINKGLDLQKENKKRTHSIKKALEKFLHQTNVIEKLKTSLYSIEMQKNNEENEKNNSNKSNKNNSNKSNKNKMNENSEAKIKGKIFDIVKKLANKVIIEKVPDNKFIVKMNERGDNCYFLLSGKLSIMKPVEYKNIKISYQDYITYLINLLKYNEIDLINQILKINHYFINIKSIEDFRVIIKGFFIDKINKYLELFNNLTYDDIETLLNAYNLTFEDFKLKKEQVIQDLNDINNNKYKTKDSYDSSSEREKNKKEILTKNMILKGYILNKFCLTIDEKINLSNYSFLFNPKEDNKSNPVTLYKYEYFLYLNPGSFFGDMALETKIRKRNATIRTEEECFILSLSNDDYISLLFEDNKKLKSLDLIFLNSKFFFNDISPVIFDKYYFALFKSLEKVKGDIIYEQETEFSSIYFLKEGNVKLELNASIIDIHNLIKFFIDIIEEKNYLHFSSKKIENLRNNYLNDKELLQLRSKNYLYLQKFNEKQKFEISTINKYECLGDLELFLTSGYIHTSTIVSQKASIIEIKKKDLCKIFNEEKDVLPNYYNFVMNKLISQIKRLYYIKNNFINLIKSKIKNNYYDNVVSPNFFDQIKNNNTSTYYDKKVELKKIVPKVFKYSHFDPPTIFDSKWKQKYFDKEKNIFYFFNKNDNKSEKNEKKDDISISKSISIDRKSKKNVNVIENENEINNRNHANKKLFYNLRFKKILEEASTTKTLSNSHSKSKTRNIIQKQKQKEINNDILLKRESSELFSKKSKNSQTIIAGKYHLSLSKLEKQFNNFGKSSQPNLNIVKNNDIDILREKIRISKSPSMIDFSSSTSTIFLPPIKNYRKNLIKIDKKKLLNPIQTKDTFVDLTIDMNNESVKNADIKLKANSAISQVIKNFYLKHKNNGYTSFINRHNNRYYKISKKDIEKIINK